MQFTPDDVKDLANTAQPYMIGGLGATVTFSYEVLEKSRPLRWAVLALWVVLGALFAGWMDEALSQFSTKYDIELYGRGPVLFFTGGAAFAAYPKVREIFISVLVGLAEKAKALVDKFTGKAKEKGDST